MKGETEMEELPIPINMGFRTLAILLRSTHYKFPSVHDASRYSKLV